MKKHIPVLIALLLLFTMPLSGCVKPSFFNFIPGETLVETGVDLNGTYDTNDLIINKVKASYKGKEIVIPEIEGLKNTSVMEKINKDMSDKIYATLDSFSTVNYTDFYILSNFANVISISYSASGQEDYESLCFNYNLVNGKELQLEDLFIKGTDTTQVIREAFYDALAYNYDSDTGFSYPDENHLYKATKAYLNSDKKDFLFSPTTIQMSYESPSGENNVYASVKIIDIPDKVSIYTKYLTKESIFTRDDISFDNIFTCAPSDFSLFFDIQYGFLEPNLWFDVSMYSYDYFAEEIDPERLDTYNKFKREIYDRYESESEYYRNIAKANPDKVYVVFSKPNVSMFVDSEYIGNSWEYTYSDMAQVNLHKDVFEMSEEVFKTTFYDALVDAYRYEYFSMGGGASIYDGEYLGATVTSVDETYLYNYKTGKELYDLDDVFFPRSDYMDDIRGETVSRLTKYYGYSYTDAKLMSEYINCRLDGTQIIVTIPGVEDFSYSIYLGYFDHSDIKHY